MTMNVAAPIIGEFFGETLDGGGFIQDDKHVMVTLSPADDSAHEVVAVIRNLSADSGLTWTVVRGQDGTSPAVWPVGTNVQVRSTADTLNKSVLTKTRDALQVNVVQSTPPYNAWNDNNQLFVDIIQKATTWTANQGYAQGDVAYIPSSQVYGLAIMGGTSHASTQPTGAQGDEVIDGTVKWLLFGSSIAALHDLPADLGHYVGQNMRGCLDGISYGEGNRVIRGMAIGRFCETTAFDALAVGDVCAAHYTQSVAFGTFAQALHGMGLFTNNVPAANLQYGTAADGSTTDPAFFMDNNLVGVLWSGAVDFTGGTAWAASTGIKQGRVRHPTTPNGLQYVRSDGNLDGGGGAYADNYPSALTTTDTTEPTWTTTQGDFISDDGAAGSGGWFAFPNVGRQIGLLPENFVVEEIGIVILEMSGVTAQPFVSFGKAGSNAAFVANGQTTGLTAANKVQRFVLTNTEAVTQVTMSINTLATGSGAVMLGRVYFKGFFCKHWL